MTRPRAAIKVYVTPAEREAIKQRADAAGLSLSDFLRTAALNLKIRSVLDMDAVTELAKLNGELGRCATMFKPLLEIEQGTDLKKLVKEFRELQKQSLDIMGKIRR